MFRIVSVLSFQKSPRSVFSRCDMTRTPLKCEIDQGGVYEVNSPLYRYYKDQFATYMAPAQPTPSFTRRTADDVREFPLMTELDFICMFYSQIALIDDLHSIVGSVGRIRHDVQQ